MHVHGQVGVSRQLTVARRWTWAQTGTAHALPGVHVRCHHPRSVHSCYTKRQICATSGLFLQRNVANLQNTVNTL